MSTWVLFSHAWFGMIETKVNGITPEGCSHRQPSTSKSIIYKYLFLPLTDTLLLSFHHRDDPSSDRPFCLHFTSSVSVPTFLSVVFYEDKEQKANL